MYNDDLTKKLAETAERVMAGESVETIKEGAEKDTKGDKEAYTKFFNDTLKKYGVESPAELSDEDKKKFFDEIDAGWKADDEKPEKNESVELEEGKIDLNKKFKTSDAAFDYFHSFAVADQAKTDQEVEKSKKKFAKNTLGFWMQNLTDTLKGMGIGEETELELTEEEEDLVASILETEMFDIQEEEQEDPDGISEEVIKLDARRREFREKIKQLAYEKAKQMNKGITDADEEEGVNSSLEVQKFESIDAVSVSHVKEEIGDKVNEETEEPEIIQIARRIVKNQQFEKVKDPVSGKRMVMDMFTANAITQVYDALSDANKANMVKYPLPKMVDLVFKLLKKVK